MLLDRPLETILKELGSTGSEQYWEHFTRGHHIDEIIDLFFGYGYALIPITKMLMGSPNDVEEPKLYKSAKECESRFMAWMLIHDGILITQKHDHACAWNHKERKVYDPSKGKYDLELSKFDWFWAMLKIEC